MIRCLITGKLHDAPQARTSATGNTFAVAKVKADDKNGAWVWVSIIAFGQEAERLLTLKAGDAVAIGGRAEIGAWLDKEGNAHGSLSLVADEIATLRALNDLRADALGDPTDNKAVERMLLAQSVVLQSMFANYMTRASRTDTLPKLQAFADLALKAQNQCRRTLATLAEVRNPRRTQFIKQVNNAVNQQVNNEAGPTDKSLATTDSRKIPESEPLELLTVIPGETLDTGRTTTPIGGRASLEAVGAFDRPKDAGR